MSSSSLTSQSIDVTWTNLYRSNCVIITNTSYIKYIFIITKPRFFYLFIWFTQWNTCMICLSCVCWSWQTDKNKICICIYIQVQMRREYANQSALGWIFFLWLTILCNYTIKTVLLNGKAKLNKEGVKEPRWQIVSCFEKVLLKATQFEIQPP